MKMFHDINNIQYNTLGCEGFYMYVIIVHSANV